MLPSPCFLFSDAHLTDLGSSAERRLLGLLEHVGASAGSLVINGDLFDFWFEWRTVIPRRSFRVLAALRALTERSISVVWVAGNHDCWGGEILRDDVGVSYHLDAWEGSAAGWAARVEHGDGLRPREDRWYRVIKPIMRNRLAIRAFRALPADLATRIATGSSEASRGHRSADEGAQLRAIAREALRRSPGLELLVYGHSHLPVLEQTDWGVYANAGGWCDRPTYLRITPGVISLREWTGSADGVELHAVDRGTEKDAAHS